MKVVLISCVKSKLPHSAEVSALYISPLFKGAPAYARRLDADRIYVLSAKHGLLELNQVIEPYEETLTNKRVAALQTWAKRVADQLADRVDLRSDHFVFLAGESYRKSLIPYMRSVEIPLHGKTFGQQLSFYASLK